MTSTFPVFHIWFSNIFTLQRYQVYGGQVRESGIHIHINQSINQISIAPISPAYPGSVAQQPDRCSNTKSLKLFRNINRPLGHTSV